MLVVGVLQILHLPPSPPPPRLLPEEDDEEEDRGLKRPDPVALEDSSLLVLRTGPAPEELAPGLAAIAPPRETLLLAAPFTKP